MFHNTTLSINITVASEQMRELKNNLSAKYHDNNM